MMSFSNRALQRVHKLAPKLPLVYLVDATMPALTWDGMPAQGRRRRSGSTCGCCAGPRWSRPSSGAGTRSTSGPSTHHEEVDRCLELGVDVIITNRPGHVLRQVAAIRLGLAA